MKISLKWLADYVTVPEDLKPFCDRLDLTGTGVEGVESLGASFDKIVTSEIVGFEKHPDSDHLWITRVNVGEWNLGADGKPEPLQIVCGAPNVPEVKKTVTALVGAKMPDGTEIKKGKLRGVTSCGMNCSARELGLSADHAGILSLPEDAPVGVPAAKFFGLGDTVLDLEITPNRPDCLSVAGFAREVGAMYHEPVRNPLPDMLAAYSESTAAGRVEDLASVEIADVARCKRYTARIIKGVKIGPSPEWLVERLSAIGARPINNVVDVTNYILFLFGQPLHAFDFDKLVALSGEDGKARIIVRPAEEGEHLQTLDGADRALTPDMTVIATPGGAVALAGVMGGMNSEVTQETTSILLEAATFNRSHTSRTSRNLGLISESSIRYERTVDDNPIADYSAAAAALIAELSGGTVCEGIVDEWPERTMPAELKFRVLRFCDMMGADIPVDEITRILTDLGCVVAPTNSPEVLAVTAPTFRPDLEREIDLYEEVLRLHGMDRIPPTLPGGRGRFGARTVEQQRLTIITNTLRASGMNETMTYSFADPDELAKLRMDAAALGLGEAVELINPMSADMSQMRRSIIPGLLRSVAYNMSRGVGNVQLFEVGAVFSAAEGRKQPKERKRLAGVLAGAMAEPSWNTAPAAFDFFDGKGIIENLVRELAVDKVRFEAVSADEAAFLQPGRGAWVLAGGTQLGWLGEIHPAAAAAYDIDVPVVAFELDVDALVKSARPARPYVDVPVYPAVNMDVAFVVDEDVTGERLEQVMKSAGGSLLESVRLFDVYRDSQRLGAGKKSMAYALVWRDKQRTLKSEEVEKAFAKLTAKVAGATGAQVRG
ncbi:MAG: phenylalanine--tRNA ligase subunit beta [Eggerthellaceae bacterium]|nr:phenylalanine--tRNA ligase subunit beta [Eggerthellaceae bacterium]